MSLKAQITDDMKAAMRAKEAGKLATIRLILADIKRREVDEQIELDDKQVLAVVEKMIKQRKDSITQFEAGGRADLADIEKAELVVLTAYMPAGLSDDEVAAEVKAAVAESGAAGPQDMGKVIGILRAKYAGRMDFSKASALVKPGMMRKSRFAYDAQADGYRCPQGQVLAYATTDRNGYRHYRSDPAICRACPLLASCTSNAKAQRTITRHVWTEARERVDAHRLTDWGKAVYKRRKETVERSFADAKQLHGHRYARFRSLWRVRVQCLLAAAAQNIKKIALTLTKAPKPSPS